MLADVSRQLEQNRALLVNQGVIPTPEPGLGTMGVAGSGEASTSRRPPGSLLGRDLVELELREALLDARTPPVPVVHPLACGAPCRQMPTRPQTVAPLAGITALAPAVAPLLAASPRAAAISVAVSRSGEQLAAVSSYAAQPAPACAAAPTCAAAPACAAALACAAAPACADPSETAIQSNSGPCG